MRFYEVEVTDVYHVQAESKDNAIDIAQRLHDDREEPESSYVSAERLMDQD